jgi:hypothetical protein
MIVFLILLLMNQQQPRALLGAAQPERVKVTGLGIMFEDGGYSRDKPKKMRKTIDWMTRKGYRPDLINNFGNFALLLNDPDFIPREIDKAFTQIQSLWMSCTCGGKHRRIAESVDPKSLRIIIEAAPFRVGNNYAKGAAMDNFTIRVAIICFYNNAPPPQADLRDIRHLLPFELGNLFGIRGGYQPVDSDHDVGSKSPCGIF